MPKPRPAVSPSQKLLATAPDSVPICFRWEDRSIGVEPTDREIGNTARTQAKPTAQAPKITDEQFDATKNVANKLPRVLTPWLTNPQKPRFNGSARLRIGPSLTMDDSTPGAKSWSQ